MPHDQPSRPVRVMGQAHRFSSGCVRGDAMRTENDLYVVLGASGGTGNAIADRDAVASQLLRHRDGLILSRPRWDLASLPRVPRPRRR